MVGVSEFTSRLLQGAASWYFNRRGLDWQVNIYRVATRPIPQAPQNKMLVINVKFVL